MTKAKAKQTMTLTREEERTVFALQLLGDKTRFKLFKLLLSDNELCVTEIAEELGVTPSAVSQHFKNFELLGLVDKERVGQRMCYLLRNEALTNQLKEFVVQHSADEKE
jgi:ArsR family transcriptional regulator